MQLHNRPTTGELIAYMFVWLVIMVPSSISYTIDRLDDLCYYLLILTYAVVSVYAIDMWGNSDE